ncbi:RPM1 interacting protein 13-like [Carex rostrata]
MEEEGEEGERKVKAQDEAKDDDRSEIDLVEFSQKLSISGCACACASSDADEDDEVVVLGTSGPVALRDFPHPRHLCANFPFQSTPHQNCCSQCYCVSCEVVAPCSNWEGRDAHCHLISKKCIDKLETATPTENDKKII